MATINDELKKNAILGIGKKISEAILQKSEEFQKIFKEMGEAMKFYAKHIPPSLKRMANHGWYISGDSPMGESITLAIDLENGNIEKVDRELIKYYNGEIRNIISRVIRSYPERAKILNEAKAAHKNRMYFASTSLLLSTADGIFNGLLFKAKKNKKLLKDHLEKIGHLDDFGMILTEVSAIDAFRRPGKKSDNSLNRHGVMHGYDVEYGTKLNSLKALSLLAYVCDFFYKK